MTTQLKIVALGNAVTDLVAEVDESMLQSFGFKSGSHQAGDDALHQKLESTLTDVKVRAGGSLANSAYALGCLGMDITLISSIANDSYGRAFARGMHDVDVKTKITNFGDGVISQTGYVLVAPNGERTFVNLPYNTRITPEIVDEFADDIIDADLLVIEGYLFIDQTDAVDRAIELARENDVKIAITLAAENVVINFHDAFASHIEDGIDLLVANEEELEALINGAGHDEELAQCIENTTRVVTKGKDGSAYINPIDNIHATAQTSSLPSGKSVVDTNGAGDSFLGGFLSLYDTTQNPVSGDQSMSALIMGSTIASELICQIGPRLSKAQYQEAFQKGVKTLKRNNLY